MGIKYERVTVTPALAAQWLESNAENNRPPKGSRIPMYARDMLSGRWNSDTGETIKFDVHGTLIDGQNRLHAVVQAGKTDRNVTVDFDVARGMPEGTIRVIDTGASRTFGDALGFEGVKDRNRVGAVVRWAINWDAGNYLGGGRFAPTNAELWDRYRSEADAFDAATQRGHDTQRAGLSNSRVGGTACYLLTRLDADAAATFFDHYVSGAGLDYGDPVLELRNRMSRARSERLKPYESLALTFRAWNNWRAGKKVDALLLPKGGVTNANFPQPK